MASLSTSRLCCGNAPALKHSEFRRTRSRSYRIGDVKVRADASSTAPAGTSAEVVPVVNAPLESASKYIYEPVYGLPVVRERLTQAQLLHDVRNGLVQDVKWFKNPEVFDVDGPCLVVYKDGSLRQANVPTLDVRSRFAMETHNVGMEMLAPVPEPEDLLPPTPMSFFGLTALQYLPVISVLSIWLLVQAKNLMRGDAMDRAQMKRKAAEDRRDMKQQQIEDEKILNIAKMIRNKYSDEQVRSDVRRMKLDLTDAEVTALISEARKSERHRLAGQWSLEEEEEERARERQAAAQAKAQAQEGSDPDTAQADGVGRMSSMKIRQARLRGVNRTRMKGRLKNVNDDDIFFEDVAGIDEAKRELQEVVDFFNMPQRFAKSGARAPRGVLLYGPPGTGKTLLARAVAGEADATFVGVNASEFVEMFVGVGAARVRDLFQTARDNAPAVIFIDEIDAVGRIRGGSQGNDERDQTLNQMLSEMDGFDERTGLVVIAATNRIDVLDPALIRPGRFDRQVNVGLPDLDGRIEVLKVHLNKRTWDKDGVRLKELAFETQRYSGAMIANMVNTAALVCAREGSTCITHAHLEQALDIERVGVRKAPYSDMMMKRIAVVEGATALVASLLPAVESVVRVSTLPTEKAVLGQTVLKIDEQRELTRLFTRRYLEEQLLMVLAGRAAELLLLGPDNLSSLNTANLGYARRIVNKLVVSNAMTDNSAIGPRTVSSATLGGDRKLYQIVQSRVSNETQASADFEMEALLAQAGADVAALLARNRALLEMIVDKLAVAPYEIFGPELDALVLAHADPSDLQHRSERSKIESFI